MRKNLHVTQILEATCGGSRKHLRNICRGIRATGMDVDIIYSPVRADPDFDDDIARLEAAGCRLYSVPMRRAPAINDTRAYRQIKAILTQTTPNIVHTHCAKAGLIGRLAAAALQPSATIVHTPHSYFFEGFDSRLGRTVGAAMERYLGRYTSHQVCVSDAEYHMAIDHDILPADRLSVIYNGLPNTTDADAPSRVQIRHELALDDKTVAIGINARLVPQKIHSWVLDAVISLPPSIRNSLRIFIWGDGPLRQRLDTHVGKNDLGNVVKFLGYVPRVERYLVGMDIGILPSRYEGLSYQLLETLAAGIPLVATDVPGNRLSMPDNPICYVTPDGPLELTKALEHLASSPHERRQRGQRCRDWQQRHFPLDKQISQLSNLYQAIASPSITRRQRPEPK